MTDTELVRQIKHEIQSENQEPVLRFSLEPGEPALTAGKTGGTPYLPHDMPWPLDANGLPMFLLAQVDCGELKGLADFPGKGLLQFFTGLNDVFGADFDDITKPGNFRVLYHESVDRSVTADEVRAKRPAVPDDLETEYMTPLGGACRIRFGLPEMQGMTEEDYRYEKLFCDKWNMRRPDAPIQHTWDLSGCWDDGEDDGEDGYAEGAKHQMGGYPYFTQTDPRWDGRHPELDVVLFQLDSDMRSKEDGGDVVLWGDCGVGNFFISREALRRKDFSQVGYSWDCC